jgi:Tfp pilus assembly PilM family ATPase
MLKFGLGDKFASRKKEKYSVSISIGSGEIEGAIYHHELQAVTKSVIHKLPHGLIASGGDIIPDSSALSDILTKVMDELAPATRQVHLTIPCTLLRVIETPKMELDEYSIFLASEAERFRAFDNTEAVVAFELLENASTPVNQRILYTAIRRDTYEKYQKACKTANIRLASMEVEPLQIIRSMVGTGLYNKIQEQMPEPNFCWGSMIQEFDRLRFLIWQGLDLVDIREITISGQMLSQTTDNAVVLSDLVMELNRTVQGVKPLEPLFWMTHRLNYILLQHLQHEIGVGFKSFEVPTDFTTDRTDIGMVVLGGCFESVEIRPYHLNFFDKKSSSKKGGSTFSLGSLSSFNPASFEGLDISNNPLVRMVVPAMGAGVILVVVGWFSLMGINTYNEASKIEIEQKQKQLTSSIQQTTTELTHYTQMYLLSEKILSVVNESKQVNTILLDLLTDIQYLPPTLWFSEVGYNKQVTIIGNALHAEDVLNLTGKLEQRSYGKDFILHYINEEEVSPEEPLIYNFMLGGLLNTSGVKLIKPKEKKEKNKNEKDENTNAAESDAESVATENTN